jgi:hypothetical protein
LRSPLLAVTSSLSIYEINESIQFAIDFRQTLSNFGQVSFGSAHVATQRHTVSRESSHDPIILRHHSLKTIQPFFGLHKAFFRLRKALVGLGEFGVESRVHARLILEQELNGPFDVHAGPPFCTNED